MNSTLFDVLRSMTDNKTAHVLISVLPPRTVQIANSLLKRGVVTGYFRDYAFFRIEPKEFVDIMESTNSNLNLIDT